MALPPPEADKVGRSFNKTNHEINFHRIVYAGFTRRIFALLVDRFGLLKIPVHALNWQRLVGVVLMIADVCLVKKF